MQSIKISNILLPFPPPHLIPLLMLSFKDLKYTLPGLRPFSRPRALVVVIVTVLILAIVPISNILESNATVTKEFEVHCHYTKVYSQKF